MVFNRHMPYAEGRTFFDADSHLMELPEWLPSYAEPAFRERIKPYSLGSVKIASADPHAEPQVAFNLLSDPRDLVRLVDGVVFGYEIMRHPAVRAMVNEIFPSSFSERIRNLNRYSKLNLVRSSLAMLFLEGPAPLRRWLLRTLVSPGATIADLIAVRDDLTAWVAARATPFYHPVGTCRMGAADDPDAVLDSDCRVRGVERLRVIDASIMPTITRAATHLTTIMLAEKMADRLKAATSG